MRGPGCTSYNFSKCGQVIFDHTKYNGQDLLKALAVNYDAAGTAMRCCCDACGCGVGGVDGSVDSIRNMCNKAKSSRTDVHHVNSATFLSFTSPLLEPSP